LASSLPAWLRSSVQLAPLTVAKVPNSALLVLSYTCTYTRWVLGLNSTGTEPL
jgi:hypothetical protein